MLTRPLTQPLTGPLVRGVGEGGTTAPSLNNYSVSNPIYIAHRGGSLMYPEETTEGYAASFAAGNRVLEMDVQLLSDGGLGLMHDATVDRTTTSTGNVASFDTVGWRALAIDANTWHGSNFGNALVPPLFPAIVAAYGGRAILVPESKSGGTDTALVAALVAAGIPKSMVLQQAFGLTELDAAVAAGYPAMILTTDSTGIAAAQAAGVTWAGVDAASADAVFTAWINAGFKTTAFVVTRRYRCDQLTALGVMGFFSDDPQYSSRRTPLLTADTFATQTWMPGMMANSDSIAALERGAFSAPDYWGYAANSTAFNSCLMGALCPVKGSNNPTFSMDFSVKFDSANANDGTRWASVFINKDDNPFFDGAAHTVNEQGFHFLLRKAGQIQIYKRTTSASTQVANVSTVAIADGEEVKFRIAYTSAGVNLYRLDAGGNIAYTASYADTDTAFRGGYVHLNRSGLACRFRHITVS